MPSPILKYTSGTFKHMRSQVTLAASKKRPVWAYRRDTTSKNSTKGAWGYTPRGRKSVVYRVSVVAGHGYSSASRDAARLSMSTTAVPSATYRQTSDWLWSQHDPTPKKVGVPKKLMGKLGRYTRKVGRGRVVTKEEYDTYMAQLNKARTLKSQAVKSKQSAQAAKSPKVKRDRAKVADQKAEQAKAIATKIIESAKAPKAIKEQAKATKRAARKTEVSAEQIVAKAKRAETKRKAKASKRGAKASALQKVMG